MFNSKVLKRESIVITRKEANFDRACDEAYKMAISVVGIDDCGHSTKVEGWDRSSCNIRVTFKEYTHVGSMVGHEYVYGFIVEAVRGSDDN